MPTKNLNVDPIVCGSLVHSYHQLSPKLKKLGQRSNNISQAIGTSLSGVCDIDGFTSVPIIDQTPRRN